MGVHLQSLTYLAAPILRSPRKRPARLAATIKFCLRNIERKFALVHINHDAVARFHEAYRPAFRRFRRNVTDRNTGGSAREPPIGDERAYFPEAAPLRYEVG